MCQPLARQGCFNLLEHIEAAVVGRSGGGEHARAGGDGVNADPSVRPLYGQALREKNKYI